MNRQLWDLDQLARFLKLHPDTLRRRWPDWARDYAMPKPLPFHGRRPLWDTRAIEAWLDQLDPRLRDLAAVAGDADRQTTLDQYLDDQADRLADKLGEHR